MRARLGAVALSAAALLLTAPAVRAQDTGSSAWSGSSLTLPASSEVGVVHVNAYFTRNPARSIAITIYTSGDPPPHCAMPPATGTTGTTPTSHATDLSFGCNGVYHVTAVAATTNDSPVAPHDEATRSGTVEVQMPAPTVTGVSASGEGRSITVVWDDMTVAAPDLSGYVVERQIGDGEFTEVASLGADATSFVDDTLPSDAGEATYRVMSIRPSPSGTKVSAASDTGATPFVAAPTPPPDGSTPPDDGTTPGDGTTPDTTPDTTPATTPGTTAPGTPGAPGPAGAGGPGGGSGVQAPRLGISGAFLPPLLRPSASMSPPTTIDGGFDNELPYSDTEPGEDDPVLPDDELASLFTDGAAGRGMAIPIATALVLAVWAFHLRFLARASRPIP